MDNLVLVQESKTQQMKIEQGHMTEVILWISRKRMDLLVMKG